MDRVITIVSGLPRSGTSMMMKMIQAGGMDVVTDDIRRADRDNPKGYYEFEKVKKIKEDVSWLETTRGKTFKMVSMLLYDLPDHENYKIIFMKRNMEEILTSQKRMLERQKPEEANVDYMKMGRLYEKHLKHLEPWFEQQENMDVIYINYNDLIANPREHLDKVNKFLGYALNVEEMMQVIDLSLYRNRSNISTANR
jgi:hypothetical protein